jgi:hypothetical protein
MASAAPFLLAESRLAALSAELAAVASIGGRAKSVVLPATQVRGRRFQRNWQRWLRSADGQKAWFLPAR